MPRQPRKPPETTSEERESIKNAGRAAAAKTLRTAHEAEYQEYLEKEFTARGVEYKPRMSSAARDEATLRDILARRPDLAVMLTSDDASAANTENPEGFEPF